MCITCHVIPYFPSAEELAKQLDNLGLVSFRRYVVMVQIVVVRMSWSAQFMQTPERGDYPRPHQSEGRNVTELRPRLRRGTERFPIAHIGEIGMGVKVRRDWSPQPEATRNFLKKPLSWSTSPILTTDIVLTKNKEVLARINSAYACKLTGRSTKGFFGRYKELAQYLGRLGI